MTKRLIFLLDLLGFSEAVRNADASGMGRILTLLESFAEAIRTSARFDVPISPERREIIMHPSVSAFSDHIVYSYELAHVIEHIPYITFWTLSRIVAGIALEALRFGCLVRGAITVGALHHKDNVIVGPGIIEAHKMESHFAHYPRIIVSDEAAKLTVNPDSPINPSLFRDNDGWWCLDYMNEALDSNGFGVSTTELQAHNQRWIAEIRKCCDTELARLTLSPNSSAFHYWKWFRSYFDQTVSKRHQSVTGERRGNIDEFPPD